MVHESDYQKHQSVPSQKNLSINKLQRACSTIDKGFNKVRMTTGHRAKEPMPKLLDMARWCLRIRKRASGHLKEDFRTSTTSTGQPMGKREPKSFLRVGVIRIPYRSYTYEYIKAASKHNHNCISVPISIANGSMPCFQ